MLDISKDYDTEITYLFLKNNKGWTKVKSKKFYKKTAPTYGKISMYTLKPFLAMHQERFMELKIAKQEVSPIQTEHFTRKSKSSISLGDFNNHGRSGWDGMGYFSLKHKSESIHFKGYGFNHRLDKNKIYYPIEKQHDFLILYLHKKSSDDRLFKNTGIYVLRKK
ncbi:MAG: hypothetical protein JKY08_07225 [Flavobacteriaceae bacterium]|nr:hypothetical protein [Flavobacteriaceae bacterium]